MLLMLMWEEEFIPVSLAAVLSLGKKMTKE